MDETLFHDLLSEAPPTDAQVQDVLARSLDLHPLSLPETAILVRARQEHHQAWIREAARALKRRVYGNRVVLFAPLYVGNLCVNDCAYCAFRRSNSHARRHTLSSLELEERVRGLERAGHKRLILVFGEHRAYDAETIARTVEQVYAIRDPEHRGEIRRLNLNAAPQEVEGYRRIKQAGIGTYQIFQETYHHGTYAAVHPAGTPKSDYLYRLDGPGRAIDAGLDDVGIGALFGLYDWRFEVLGLVAHALHLQEAHGVGPHTLSVPRLRPTQGPAALKGQEQWAVSDGDMARVVAILRLAVPYTGIILTAREPAAVRRELLGYGVSQIDGGSRIDLHGSAQFSLGDERSLDEVLGELLQDGYLPSFCTACYRLGRTGEHFMEFAVPGFIKRFCTPNALTTLTEYLEDYASPRTRQAGVERVAAELEGIPEGPARDRLVDALERIRRGERDLCF